LATRPTQVRNAAGSSPRQPDQRDRLPRQAKREGDGALADFHRPRRLQEGSSEALGARQTAPVGSWGEPIFSHAVCALPCSSSMRKCVSTPLPPGREPGQRKVQRANLRAEMPVRRGSARPARPAPGRRGWRRRPRPPAAHARFQSSRPAAAGGILHRPLRLQTAEHAEGAQDGLATRGWPARGSRRKTRLIRKGERQVSAPSRRTPRRSAKVELAQERGDRPPCSWRTGRSCGTRSREEPGRAGGAAVRRPTRREGSASWPARGTGDDRKPVVDDAEMVPEVHGTWPPTSDVPPLAWKATKSKGVQARPVTALVPRRQWSRNRRRKPSAFGPIVPPRGARRSAPRAARASPPRPCGRTAG